MTKVGFILPPTVGVLRGSRVCSTSVTTTRLVAVKLRGLNHHHERNRLAPPCCDEYRIAPLQSGMLVCKRAGRRVPIGGTRIGHVLAIALCALLIGYKLRQQRLHRGRQVVGVGLGCATRASLSVRLTGRFPADVALVCILKTPNSEMRILCSSSLKPPIFCHSRHQ